MENKDFLSPFASEHSVRMALLVYHVPHSCPCACFALYLASLNNRRSIQLLDMVRQSALRAVSDFGLRSLDCPVCKLALGFVQLAMFSFTYSLIGQRSMSVETPEVVNSRRQQAICFF